MTTAAPEAPARLFRVVGTSDEVNACDCCGKTKLKSTVELFELDADGNDVADHPVYFGVTCAARAMHREVKAVRSDVLTADRAREAAARAAKWAADDEARGGGTRIYGTFMTWPEWEAEFERREGRKPGEPLTADQRRRQRWPGR